VRLWLARHYRYVLLQATKNSGLSTTSIDDVDLSDCIHIEVLVTTFALRYIGAKIVQESVEAFLVILLAK
jgi:hypothetical protein